MLIANFAAGENTFRKCKTLESTETYNRLMENAGKAISLSSNTERLATFSASRSENIIVTSYAAAGFSYAAESGYISCDGCGLTLQGCDIHAYDAVSLHKTYAPTCKFLATTDFKHVGKSIVQLHHYSPVVV